MEAKSLPFDFIAGIVVVVAFGFVPCDDDDDDDDDTAALLAGYCCGCC
jgi:hypothetical protein